MKMILDNGIIKFIRSQCKITLIFWIESPIIICVNLIGSNYVKFIFV